MALGPLAIIKRAFATHRSPNEFRMTK
jgi:hypothetical protein